MPRTQLATAQAHYQSREYAEAERVCREVLRARPGDMTARRLLGQITRHTGKAGESVRVFQELRRARPNDVPLVGELGASLTVANLHAQALPLLQQAVRSMPKAAVWRVWLGRCLTGLFQFQAAIGVLREAHDLAPDDPDASFHLANALLNTSDEQGAEPHARAYLARHPGSVAGRSMLAKVLEGLSRLDEAIGVLDDLLGPAPGASDDPGLDQALGVLLRCLNAKGLTDQTRAICDRVAARAPTPNLLAAIAPVYLQQGRHQEVYDLLAGALEHRRMPDPIRAGLIFRQAEALQGLGRHDDSFLAFVRANSLYPDTFRRDLHARFYEALRETFSTEHLRTAPRGRLDASRCVFIVGMPRSGTSLVEQIIDAHPLAFGAGELETLPEVVRRLARDCGGQPPMSLAGATADLLDRAAGEYLTPVGALAPDARVITDKLPHNYEFLALINLMLPGARVIHCTRDPVDNCVSAFCTQLSAWHDYSNRLDQLGAAYAHYAGLMDHYLRVCDLPILGVRYEEVVTDLEPLARRILAFVGLPWDERCLRFYETDRTVTTASVDQVRRPVYTSSVARWKRYEPHLGPLLDALREGGVPLEGV